MNHPPNESTTMSELNPTPNGTAHKIFEGASDKVADTLRPVIDQLKSGVHVAVDRLADVAAQTVDQVELSGEYLKDSQTRMAAGCRSYVRAKPLTTVGVAVAGGFLLSWLLRQR